MKINDMIIEGYYYKALKEAQELLSHEEELIENVKGRQSKESAATAE